MAGDSGTGASADVVLKAFEVDLGSFLYVRLRTDGGFVRVLADGGFGLGVAGDHVQREFPALLGVEKTDRLDLVIGTHYDEDHLGGLVPVLRSGLRVGEVWLPPIVDDTAAMLGDARVGDGDLIGRRFERDPAECGRYVAA